MVKPQTGLEVDHDDEGNDLAVPDAKTDVGQLIYLLEWSRRRGFRIGPAVQIGGLTVQVEDLRLAAAATAHPPDRGAWAAAGFDEDDDA